jgi:serine/threonine-protein kinase
MAGGFGICSVGSASHSAKGMHNPTRQDRENPAKGDAGPASQTPVAPEFVQAELERVLASKTFSSSPRLSRFLRFTVEQTIQGHKDKIKEYLLGVDVFDRGRSYDPRIDPIVRVEAGRLRTKLQQYYISEGARAPLVFELPKGRYIPSFRTNDSPQAGNERHLPRFWRPLGFQGISLLVIGLLGLGIMLYWIVHSLSRKRSDFNSAAAVAGAPIDKAQNISRGGVSSIAVLPFEDLSPQKDQAYFCDGMTDTLINALTKVAGLRVAARTSAFSFRDKQVDIGTIGEKLHVGAVLEGSVRKADKRLRVSAQLVNVSDGLNIWSEVYDRNIEDIFAIQDEISWAIVNALENKLAESSGTGKQLAKTYTRNPDAYALYLRGQYHLAQMTRPAIDKSMSYFTKAIEVDPSYALAYAGMAEAYNLLGNLNFSPPHEVMPKAKAAALKALAIDESLAEAHAALGLVKSTYDWDWQGAEREFRRAIELNPGYVSAYQWYGLTCLASTGRMGEALAAISQARSLDPLSLLTNTNLATVLMRLGRYDEAIRVYKETIDLEPGFFWAYRDLGLALYEKHSFRDSIDALEKANTISNGNPGVLAALGYCYGVTGNTTKAQNILNELKELSRKTYVPPYHVAAVYLGLGNKVQALEWLDRAYEDRSIWMNGIGVDPLFASLRKEPQFIAILKGMGLE